LKRLLNNYALLAAIAVPIIVVDQISKAYLRSQLAPGEMWAPWDWLMPYARIIHVTNTGAAFGIFQGLGDVFRILAIIVAGAILWYFPQVPKAGRLLRIALSMQFAGAVGNLIDRFRQGFVTDFISIGTFPVWNVADASITVGVGVLLLGMWLQERRDKKAAQGAQANADNSDTPAENGETL